MFRTVFISLLLFTFPTLASEAAWGKLFFDKQHKKEKSVIFFKTGTDSFSHPQMGDIVTYQLILKNYKDTTIFDTHYEFGAQQLRIEKPGFKYDLNEQLCSLHKGDSALIFISCDSLYGNFMPQFAKHKKYMKFYITLIDFMSYEKWEEKTKQVYIEQAHKDSILINNYLTNKRRKSIFTTNGLGYFISKEMNAAKPQIGDTVWVNYTGRLVDGNIFDSNTDARFGHAEPFKFVVGKGNVIKGWDQGLLLFGVGDEGQLYIPSGLAYGKRSSGMIPANAVLIFDIALVKISHPIPQDK